MNFTVNDLMMLPEFEGAKVVAGHIGISRTIDYIDILESPDGANWFKPNDLVVTTAYPLLQVPGSLQAFMETLYDRRVSALAVKVGRYVDQIPETLVTQADALGLPLIELPSTAIYADLISSVTAQIIDSHMLQLQESLNTNYMFIDIARNGGNISEISSALANTIHRPVIIENDALEVLSCAFPDDQDATFTEKEFLFANHYVKTRLYLPALKEELYSIYHFPVTGQMPCPFSISPIVFQDSILGNITVAHINSQIEMNELALKNAATFTALSLSAMRSQKEKERMIRDGVLTDLFYGKSYAKESISYWISFFQLEKELPCLLFLIRPQQADKMSEDQFYVFRQQVTHYVNDAYFFLQDRTLIFIRSFRCIAESAITSEVELYFQNLQTALCRRAADVKFYIAFGTPCRDFFSISENYRQASVALEIGQQMLPPNSLCRYSELDLYELFYEHQNRAMLRHFLRQYLHPLLQDGALNFDTLGTMQVYLDCNCSVEKASVALDLHKNTVKYRVNRLKERLGSSMDDPHFRLKLQLALALSQLFPDILFEDMSPPI